MARDPQFAPLSDGIHKGTDGGHQVVVTLSQTGNLIQDAAPGEGAILCVNETPGTAAAGPLIDFGLRPLPADQGVLTPHVHPAELSGPVGLGEAENLTIGPAAHSEQGIDVEALVVFLLEGLRRPGPCHDLFDLGAGKQAQHGNVLTTAAGDLAAESVHGHSQGLAVSTRVQALAGFLNLGHGALQIAACKNDSPFPTGFDHGVGISQPGGHGFVGGNTLDPGFGTGDDGFLHILAGRDDRRQVGNDFLQHGVDIFKERLDSEAFSHNLAPFRIPLGNGDQFGVGQRPIDLGEVLSHAAATDDADTISLFGRAAAGQGRQSCQAGGSCQRLTQKLPAVHIHAVSSSCLWPSRRKKGAGGLQAWRSLPPARIRMKVRPDHGMSGKRAYDKAPAGSRRKLRSAGTDRGSMPRRH